MQLGAEFVHGDAEITTKLLDEARLVTYPVTGEHYRSDHGELTDNGPIWERTALVFKRMSRSRKIDRSFQDFLDEKPGGPALRREREMALGFIQGFNAAYASLISEKSLADQGDPAEGAAEARKIIRGYGALIDYMKRDLSDRILVRKSVKRIAWNSSGARVFDQSGKAYAARRVILAVPLPMLQDDSIVFDPEIPSLRSTARQLQMGQVIRVNVVVKERFWENKADDLAYVHTPLRPFAVWWTQNPLKAPVITGWAGGPTAVAISDAGSIEDTALRELANAFGARRDRIEDVVESIHYHDWKRDRFIRGAYSYVGVGGTYAPRILARPVDRTLYVAGEATDSGSSGTVEGALASGRRAARQILSSS